VAISLPRALTASIAASNVSEPAATSAPYSPTLWPITMSGRMPYASSSWVSPSSMVATAGWVISVCSNWCSTFATASGSELSVKMYDDSGRPSSGVMIRSASVKAPAMIGCESRSDLSMLTYCEPCPV
jgi:hypothetical protein